MAKYRIVKRVFWCEPTKEWLHYYFVDKKTLWFWGMVKCNLDTIEQAEDWISGKTRTNEETVKEINL